MFQFTVDWFVSHLRRTKRSMVEQIVEEELEDGDEMSDVEAGPAFPKNKGSPTALGHFSTPIQQTPEAIENT